MTAASFSANNIATSQSRDFFVENRGGIPQGHLHIRASAIAVVSRVEALLCWIEIVGLYVIKSLARSWSIDKAFDLAILSSGTSIIC